MMDGRFSKPFQMGGSSIARLDGQGSAPARKTAWGIGMVAVTWLGLVMGVHGQDLVELEEQAIRAAIDRVAPAVVRIETIGGLEQVGDVLAAEGPTTGLAVSSDGYIISSAFNFIRQPTSILVVLPGGKRVPAQIVARDQSRMLVLLKIAPPAPLTVPQAAPLAEVRVGQTAIALGRALHPEQPNLSVGIISAKERIFGKAVQTDAKISPSNYGGPLIDLRGRVVGVLVPMSPDQRNELAGAEWYDGGIGFAVPLVDIQTRLDRMKQGESLQPGMLGVTMKQGDMYSLPAEVVAAHPKSPVYQAGLRAGDRIVEVNGVAIERQVQLKHVLGPLYAGEKVQLVTTRGAERRELTVELVDELEPYEHAFLGLLPERTKTAAAGVGLREIYSGSVLEKAGLKAGDRLLQFDGKTLADAAQLREIMAAYEPGKKVPLRYLRDGKEATAEVELGTIPGDLPENPPADRTATKGPDAAASVKTVDIKIPAEPNECTALVPAGTQPETPPGLIVYLPQPGDFKPEAFSKRWQPVCQQFNLIVVAPRATLPNMWLPTEVGFVRKVVEHMVANYPIDRQRIVVHGYQASGSMAYLTAFRHRDLIRGVVAIDSGISGAIRPPDNDPVERLAFVTVVGEESPLRERILAGVKVLQEMKFPVAVLQHPGEPRELNSQELLRMARWVDRLDRL